MAPATQPAIFTGTSRIYCYETRVHLIRECMKLIPRHWLISAIACVCIHICDDYTGRALAVKQ